jgi:MFS transporter, SP family, sugar:H+ symporter
MSPAWTLNPKQEDKLTCSNLRYDTGTIGGILAMPYWQDEFSTGHRNPDGHLDVSSSQSAMIVSILSAGTFFGALTAAPVGDLIGRRWGLIASTAIVFNLGVILQTAATDIPIFVAGRFFAGYGVGLISALSECEILFKSCSN